MKQQDELEYRKKVRDFLKGQLASRGDVAPFHDDESLLVSGRLDSLAVVGLVMFLEQTFGVDFSVTIFEASELDSVDAICNVLQLS
jgi:acyl carrier protein